jgi:3-phenylpropionate/trans-cinnamate dioxygenase ferredoxin subunit
MSDFIKIGNKEELNEGEMKRFQIKNHDILIAQVDGSFYGVDNQCPHMGQDLSKGTIEGTIVTCPRHHSQFDIKDGSVVRWTDWKGIKLSLAKKIKSPRPLQTYEIKIEGDAILAKI